MPNQVHGIDAADIDRTIQLLIRNLVEIKDTSGEFLLRLDDGRVIDTKGWNDWEWTHGVGLYGIWKYYQQTSDARCREIMLDWFRDRFAAGTPTKNINTVAPFLTLAYLYEESPNSAWLPYLDEWAEWLMDGLPRTEENGFQHIVFNSENRAAALGRHADDERAAARQDRQVVRPPALRRRSAPPVHAAHQVPGRSQDRTVVPRLDLRRPPPLRQRAVGARQLLGDDRDPGVHRAARPAARRRACATSCSRPTCSRSARCVKHQDKGGLWHTLIDDPNSYLEASATAGFAYGILKSVRKGYIGTEFEEAGVRAVKAVLANIDASGELKNVSFGTPVFNDLDGYRNIPLTSMPYGQAMAILALGEFKRVFI